MVDWEGWTLQEATFEPIENILTANEEVRAFEETLAAMPRLEAFVTLSWSGCCFGKLCQFQEAGSASPALDRCGLCDAGVHCTCAAENSWPRP